MDTIAAIATPMGRGGIGIIRISGPRATNILNELFQAFNKKRAHSGAGGTTGLQSHYLHYGHIVDPRSGLKIDEVMAVVMAAPCSYTREDVVEIQCHGGPVTLEIILELVTARGARTADPGEFTQRAFLNGRIDLSQAEAVAELISAENRDALFVATKQLNGELKNRVDGLVRQLTELAAELEAHIEFSDDLDTALDQNRFSESLHEEILPAVAQLISSYQKGQLIIDGLKIAIAGRPNVGKSSLMNRLVGKDKAIVTPIAGTTRDIVEQTVFSGGLTIHLSDTAGLRTSQDPVEIIGIQKAHLCMESSDVVLLVMEADEPYTTQDASILQQIAHKDVILVINKMDLVSSTPLAPPPPFQDTPEVRISALTGEGVQQLTSMLAAFGGDTTERHSHETIVFNLRHKQCLVEAFESLQQLGRGISGGLSEELLSMDLQDGIKALKKISGEGLEDSIIDAIFSKFCIGK